MHSHAPVVPFTSPGFVPPGVVRWLLASSVVGRIEEGGEKLCHSAKMLLKNHNVGVTLFSAVFGYLGPRVSMKRVSGASFDPS